MNKKRVIKSVVGWLIAAIIIYILFKTIYNNRAQLENWDWRINWFYAGLSALALGARGAVGTTYNFAAPLYRRLMEAFEAGDLDRARALQRTARGMIRILAGAPGGFLPAAKSLMARVGVDCGPVRPPLRPLAPAEAEAVWRDLDALGFEEFRNR